MSLQIFMGLIMVNTPVFLVGKEFDVVEMTRAEFEQEFDVDKPFVWESRSDAEAWAVQYRGKYVASANDER